MVDPREVRLAVWRNAVAAAQHQLDSYERCLAHPGNTVLDTTLMSFCREIAACYLDSLKATLRKIEDT